MFSPIAAPRSRRGSTSPQPKTTFQKELEAKIKNRRSRGLATDVTPQDSEDELGSDDDLMAGFNMTSKAKSPSFDKGKRGSSALDAMFGRKNEEEDLGKTWKPPGQKAPIPARRKSLALADSDEEDRSEKGDKRWQPPGHKRSDSRSSDTMKNGHVSPEVKSSSRMSRSASRNSNPASSEPHPRPRLKIKSSYSAPSISVDTLGPLQGHLNKPPVSPGRHRFLRSRSGTPKSQLEKGQDYEENSRKKSPFDDLLNGKSPKAKRGLLSDSEEDSDSDEIKKTLQKGRKSPFQQKSDEKRSPREMDAGDRRGSYARKSSLTSQDSLEEPRGTSQRRGSQGDRKSPYDERARKSPFDQRENERNERNGHFDDERAMKSPSSRRGSQQYRNDDRNEEDRLGSRRQSSTDRKSPYDDDRTRKGTSSHRGSQQYKNEESYDDRGRGERQSSMERKSLFDDDTTRKGSSSRRSSQQYRNDESHKDRGRGERQSSVDRRHLERDDSQSRRYSRQGSKDRKSPYDPERRKSPYDEAKRKSPYDGRKNKSKKSDDSEDDSDSDDQRRERSHKRSSSRGGRSSVTFEDEHHNRRTPLQDRRGTPSEGPLRPVLKNRSTEDGDRPTLHRQQRTVDEDSRRRSAGEDDLSNSAFRPVPTPRQHQAETSSVCDEMEKDPDKANRRTPEPAKRTAKSGKGRNTEKKLLDQVIDSIDGAQEDNRMKFIQDDAEKEKKDGPRPKSAKLHKPKPRYASGSTTPNLNSSLNGTFSSTTDIRDAVYQAWLQERAEQQKREKKEQLMKEKEEEEKKRKENEEKKLEALASYKAWLASKKDFGKDKIKAKKNEEKKKKKEEEDNIEKKTTAQLVYKSWKEEKDKRVKEQLLKKKRAEERELRKKQEEKEEKMKDSENAFKGWKTKKDKEIVNILKDQKKEEENNKQEEEYAKTLREEEATESYETWLARKEKQQERERRAKLRKKHLEEEEEDYVPPWSPAGRTIPMGR